MPSSAVSDDSWRPQYVLPTYTIYLMVDRVSSCRSRTIESSFQCQKDSILRMDAFIRTEVLKQWQCVLVHHTPNVMPQGGKTREGWSRQTRVRVFGRGPWAHNVDIVNGDIFSQVNRVSTQYLPSTYLGRCIVLHHKLRLVIFTVILGSPSFFILHKLHNSVNVQLLTSRSLETLSHI